MNRTTEAPHALGLPVETLFQDTYRVLEDVRGLKANLGSIGGHIARCQHEILSLEKIHANKWRFDTEKGSDDPFQLRDTLNKFVISCNALTYINSPFTEFSDDVAEGCFFPGRRGWKKKQIKILESEFFGHERSLSLALSNSVYTTVLQMQRSQPEYEASLAQILRRAERRHHIYEGLDSPIRSSEKVKLETFRIEEMDWELCLRRYFDHVQEWAPEPPQQSLSRASSFRSQRSAGSIRVPERRNSTASTGSGYGEIDTEQFTRPVRRNSLSQRQSQYSQYGEARRSLPTQPLSQQPHVQQPHIQQSQMHPHHVQQQPMAITQGEPSNALVLYNSAGSRRSSMSMEVTGPRPIRRASISRDFHWEYVGLSTSWEMLAPLSARYPDLRDAQADIFMQTQGMSSTEARAYAQGRLAILPPEITDQVKQILGSMTQVVKHQQNNSTANNNGSHGSQGSHGMNRNHRSREQEGKSERVRDRRNSRDRASRVPREITREQDSRLERERSRDRGRSRTKPAASRSRSRSISTDGRRRSTSLDPNQNGLPDRKQRQNLTGGRIPRHSMNKAPSPRRPRKPGPPRASGGLKVPKDLRPMTAISEKSHIIRSRGPSMDRPPPLPGTGAFKHLLSTRRNSISSEVLIERELSKGNSLDSNSTGNTITTNSSSPSSSTKSKKSSGTAATSITGGRRSPYLQPANSKSSPSLLDPDLINSKYPPLPNRGKPLPNPPGFSSSYKFNKSNLLALFRRATGTNKHLEDLDLDLLSPPLSPTAIANLSKRHSRESLHRMSMEVLKRKDSKVTLFSVAEGMEVPFETWLKALPYIEGRATTPRPPAAGSVVSLPDLLELE